MEWIVNVLRVVPLPERLLLSSEAIVASRYCVVYPLIRQL